MPLSQDPGGLPPDRVSDLRSLVSRAAARWPERPALTFPKTAQPALSFQDVARETAAWSGRLRRLGVRRGDHVAVMLRNRPEFPLSWLGLTTIGAVMVPVNVFYTEREVGYLLEHSGAEVAVTSSEFVPLLRGLRAHSNVKEIVDVDEEMAGESGDVSKGDAVYPETLANLQYTSGTTGHPKACMLSHGYWLRIAQKVVNVFPRLEEREVVLTAQPFYYMDPQWNLASTLLAGAHLVVLDRFHPSTFWADVRRYGVSYFYCLGMMPTALLKIPPSTEDRAHRVRAVTCSAIPPDLHRELESRWGAPWHEVFGMTETGGDLMVTEEDHDRLVGTGCIGRPYADRDVRVVDEEDRPVPRGTAGEMVLRGRGLMDGYYRNPEATAEAFRKTGGSTRATWFAWTRKGSSTTSGERRRSSAGAARTSPPGRWRRRFGAIRTCGWPPAWECPTSCVARR